VRPPSSLASLSALSPQWRLTDCESGGGARELAGSRLAEALTSLRSETPPEAAPMKSVERVARIDSPLAARLDEQELGALRL
jgi:hypothetical protein